MSTPINDTLRNVFTHEQWSSFSELQRIAFCNIASSADWKAVESLIVRIAQDALNLQAVTIECSELNNECDLLKNTGAGLVNEIQTLRGTVASQETNIRTLTTKNAAMEQTISNLEKKNTELIAANSTLEATMRKNSAEITQLKVINVEQLTRYEKLKKEMVIFSAAVSNNLGGNAVKSMLPEIYELLNTATSGSSIPVGTTPVTPPAVDPSLVTPPAVNPSGVASVSSAVITPSDVVAELSTIQPTLQKFSLVRDKPTIRDLLKKHNIVISTINDKVWDDNIKHGMKTWLSQTYVNAVNEAIEKSPLSGKVVIVS